MSKIEDFKEAAIKFRDSKKTSEDYFKFSVAVYTALRPGSGLSWEMVDSVFKEVIPDYVEQPTPQVEKRVDDDIFKFCTRFKITNLEDLGEVVGYMVDDMSEHCRSLNFEQRKPFREVKHAFLKAMYKEGIVKSAYKRISKSPLGGPGRTDVLLELKVGGCIFHIPDRNQDFVDIETLELHPQIYIRPPAKKTYSRVFEQHMDVLKRMDELVAYAQLQF